MAAYSREVADASDPDYTPTEAEAVSNAWLSLCQMPVSWRLAIAAAATTEHTNDWHGIVEHLTVWEAKQSPQWEHWHAAMQAEWESHKKNQT